MSVKSVNNFSKISRAFRDAARAIPEAQASAMIDEVNPETPVRSGHLRSRNQKARRSNYRVDAYNDAEYAGVVNGGTRTRAGNPFWNRGEDKVRTRLERIAAAEVRKKLGGR